MPLFAWQCVTWRMACAAACPRAWRWARCTRPAPIQASAGLSSHYGWKTTSQDLLSSTASSLTERITSPASELSSSNYLKKKKKPQPGVQRHSTLYRSFKTRLRTIRVLANSEERSFPSMWSVSVYCFVLLFCFSFLFFLFLFLIYGPEISVSPVYKSAHTVLQCRAGQQCSILLKHYLLRYCYVLLMNCIIPTVLDCQYALYMQCVDFSCVEKKQDVLNDPTK